MQHYLDEISEKNKKIQLKDKEIELQQKQLASFENMVGTALGRPHSTYNLNQAKFGGGFAGTGGNQSDGTLNDYSTDNNMQMQTPNSNSITCTECNHINLNNSKFCTKCGATLT